jgi:glycosyltransferase involved in cell wall biosynthesis
MQEAFDRILVKYDKAMKAKWVLDIDDNLMLVSPYSQHYRLDGIENYYDHNLKKWLWKDGENGFDLKRNKKQLEDRIQSLVEADLVTVTTQKLADFAKDYNPNVVVLPNSIDFSKWWKLPLKPHKQLRIGWSGGASHYEDLHSIKEPLNRLMRKYRFKLIMAGEYYKGLIDNDLQYLVEAYEWTDFSAHSFRMMCMDLDIGIVPLADLPFNHYKSCVKWYEFSAMKVPCVVANILPYSEEITDKNTARGYKTPAEFEKAVLSLIEDVHLKEFIAENAYEWVFKHRNAKTNAKLYAGAYESLL